MKFRRKKGGTRRRVRYVAILPTLLTLGNAVCGILALILITQPEPDFLHAAWLVLGGIIFDGLDGKVARATKTSSSFGAQLDSLCDAVTFGVVPALLIFRMISTEAVNLNPLTGRILAAVSILYLCCALIRLARFNVETSKADKHESFAGLPSPAAAALLASAVITWFFCQDDWQSLGSVLLLYAMPVMIFGTALLMVSRVQYPHVMNRVLRGFRPLPTLIEIGLLVILFYVLHQVALFVVILIYVLSGPVMSLKRLVMPRRRAEPNDESIH